METATALLARFLQAVAAGDYATMESLYAPGVRIWHSTDRVWQVGAAENVAVARKALAGIAGFRHDASSIIATESGAIAEGVLRGSIGGQEMDTPFCLIVTVKDGRITEGREYIDQGHLPRPK